MSGRFIFDGRVVSGGGFCVQVLRIGWLCKFRVTGRFRHSVKARGFKTRGEICINRSLVVASVVVGRKSNVLLFSLTLLI